MPPRKFLAFSCCEIASGAISLVESMSFPKSKRHDLGGHMHTEQYNHCSLLIITELLSSTH